MKARSKLELQAHIERAMKAPTLPAAFVGPYQIERFPRTPLPAVNVPKKMTYDEAYEEASIAAAEICGPNSLEYDDVQTAQLDLLCLKHDISE